MLGALFRQSKSGHTLDHVAFSLIQIYLRRQLRFTGDTLFVAGCGRFEGAENMFESLQKLDQLPGNTAIYCAHEYTLTNLKYAIIAEPANPAIQERLAKVEELRLKQHATVPTTLVMERLTNPFLRAKDASELAARRLQKDNF